MRVVQIKPQVYAVVGAGIVFRAGKHWRAKPIHGTDDEGLWWEQELGPFRSKRDAVDALLSRETAA